MTRLTAVLVSLLLVGLASAPAARVQARPSGTGVGDPGREDGAQLYKTWCATCHGRTGQGDGVLAPMMKKIVPDLTGIAARNGGVFPTAHVRRIIDGRDVGSHGDPEMPVWGSAFRATPDGYSDAVARARIDAIVGFLDSIQKRNAH